MRILFLSGWYPYPADNGAKIREFNLIKHLAAHHEITLLAFSSPHEAISKKRIDAMAPYCQFVATVPYTEFEPSRFRALLGFLSSRPRSIVDTFSQEMSDLVNQVSQISTFDLVLASTLRTAPYALQVSGVPRVFEDIEVAVLREIFACARTPLSRLRYGLMWRKHARYMKLVLSHFDGCAVTSEKEHENVVPLLPNGCSAVVVPNGVDLETNTGVFGAPEPDTLIYSGALTYNANFDAMKFFLRDIFPLIKARCPNVNLRITGRYDGTPVEQLQLGQGAELTGYLEDIRPAIAQSWVCVVPLRIGGGTRLKILESMALGTPVISTRKGAEGLDVTHGKDILIADEPNDFAAAVVRLLGNQDLREKLSLNGRCLVEERYSWEACAQPLEKMLKDIMQRRRSGG